MRISDGGGPGSGFGSSAWRIAAAAARAEFAHNLMWRLEDEWTVVRTFGMYDPGAHVSVNLLTGDYEIQGPFSTSITADAAQETPQLVQDRIDGWRSRIDDLFERWLDLPRVPLEAYELTRAAGELNIDPDDPEATEDRFGSVNTRLAGDLSNLALRCAQLNGEYAATFTERYVTALPATCQSLGQVVAALGVGRRAQGELWSRATSDLADFEQAAYDAMRAAVPESGEGATFALSLFGAVAGALSAIPTLGGSAVLLAAISGTASVLGDIEQDDTAREEIPLGAGDPEGVFANMTDALNRMDDVMLAQEKAVRGLMEAAYDFARGGACDLNPPGFAGAPPGSVLSHAQDVVVSPEAIAKITELWLPSIAADARQAAAGLTITASDGFTRSGDIGLAPQGAWPQFSELQQETRRLLGRLSTQLEGAADALAAAARTIGLADDAVSERYQGIERRVEHRNINDVDAVPQV
ncbi:hypothetical protein [Nocardioides sp.]|uniref:hypothetical protein n=1 Tax=Nocardioides sp. TaxID=35761 RepID=UPI003514D320